MMIKKRKNGFDISIFLLSAPTQPGLLFLPKPLCLFFFSRPFVVVVDNQNDTDQKNETNSYAQFHPPFRPTYRVYSFSLLLSAGDVQDVSLDRHLAMLIQINTSPCG